MRLEFSRFVESDLDAIAAWIAEDNPARAVTFLQEIGAQMRRVARNPLAYRLRPEIGEQAGVAVMGNYVILFRTIEAAVRVERVVYGGRDLVELFLQ